MQEQRADAAIVVVDLVFGTMTEEIASLAKSVRIATAFATREHVAARGLLSYGPSLVGSYRNCARYVSRILRGAKPADLPVEQPRTFEMVINLKTADALGIGVPNDVVLRADEVIR